MAVQMFYIVNWYLISLVNYKPKVFILFGTSVLILRKNFCILGDEILVSILISCMLKHLFPFPIRHVLTGIFNAQHYYEYLLQYLTSELILLSFIFKSNSSLMGDWLSTFMVFLNFDENKATMLQHSCYI